MINYKKVLNRQQYKAVTSIKGPHLVLSGAGSGKTRVLVYRCAYLIDKGVDPSSILLLTFTNKAANEMLFRASKLIGKYCKVTGGTFHSFAFMILKQYCSYINYPKDFSIIDEEDSKDVIKMVAQPIASYKEFPTSGLLKSIFSKASNVGESISTVIQDEYKSCKEHTDSILKIEKSYKKYKKKMGLMDFDDLLAMLNKLLKNKDIKKRLGHRYRYIMIDEAHDLNNRQFNIINKLCFYYNNIMIVGDPLQSIYRFRGANYKNILKFPKRFKGCKIIKIEQNYRSTRPILDFTNQIIENVEGTQKVKLFSSRVSNKKPFFSRPNSEFEQAEKIVEDVIVKVSFGKLQFHNFGILFRAGHHSNLIEILLTKKRIPFVKYGGQQFVSKSHVKDIIALLRVIFYPKDPMSWTRSLLLLRGVGMASVRKILSNVIIKHQGYKGLKTFKDLKIGNQLKGLFSLVRRNVKRNKRTCEVVKDVVNYYEPTLKENYNNINKRKEDIESLLTLSEYYKNTKKLLNDLVLDSQKEDKGKQRGKVVLSTIHSSKGLEWNIVYIINLTEGCLPSYQSIGKPEEIEEERRLFYVACTRAKDELHLLAPLTDEEQEFKAIGMKFKPSRLSPFIKEIKDFDKVVEIIKQK